MAQILKPNRKDNRGGHPNSGAKKKGNQRFSICCKPVNIDRIRRIIKKFNL